MNEQERAAAVALIVKGLGKNGWVGKTHVQKTALFVQEAAGIDLGFRFVIHHYGPYSFELNRLMERLEQEGLLSMTREADGYGYKVSAQDLPSDWLSTDTTKQRIEQVASSFSGLSASDMELLGTAFYVYNRFGDDFDQNVARVRSLKPRFKPHEVTKALKDAEELAKAFAD